MKKIIRASRVKISGPCRWPKTALLPVGGLKGFQPLLDLAHTARQGKLPAVFEHDDVFAPRRRLDGFDAIQIHDG